MKQIRRDTIHGYVCSRLQTPEYPAKTLPKKHDLVRGGEPILYERWLRLMCSCLASTSIRRSWTTHPREHD